MQFACKVLLSCLLSLLALCSRLDTKSMAKKGYNTKLVRLANWIILEGGYTRTQGHTRSDKSWYLDVYGPPLQVDNPKLSLCKREKMRNPHVLVVMLQGNFFLVFSQLWSWLSDSECGGEAEPDFPSTWSMMISKASLDSIRLYPGLAYTRPGIIPTIVCCIFFTLVDEMLASISMTLSPFSCTCCRRRINWTHGTERILEDPKKT